MPALNFMNKLFAVRLRRHRKIRDELEIVERELLAALRTWHDQEQQNVIARTLGVSPAYLNDVIHGRRSFGKKILEYKEGT